MTMWCLGYSLSMVAPAATRRRASEMILGQRSSSGPVPLVPSSGGVGVLLDRMYVAKVTLEAVLIANSSCPDGLMHEVDNSHRGGHGVCGSKLQLHLARHVDKVPFESLIPDFSQRFVQICPAGAKCGLCLADRRLNCGAVPQRCCQVCWCLFRGQLQQIFDCGTARSRVPAAPTRISTFQTVNLYKGPRYALPGFSYGASTAVQRDGTNTSVISTSWLPVPRMPNVRQVSTITASLAGHIVNRVTGDPSASSR